MRENRTSGSEGGEPGDRDSPTPIGEKWPSAKIAFERGLKGAFVTQRFEPSHIGVFEQILAGTMRSAQLQKAKARIHVAEISPLTLRVTEFAGLAPKWRSALSVRVFIPRCLRDVVSVCLFVCDTGHLPC